jgi:hypothetical protein
MLRRFLRTPRSPEPLPAVLAGAGFFVFLAALTGLGPFRSLDQALWRASLPGEDQSVSQSAIRVLGSSSAVSGTAQADALAADLAWLRKEGAGSIVLEAWLDQPPQAEARAFADSLFERFQFLEGKAKRQALKALSETASSIAAAPRLAAALNAAQPMVLAWQAVPGSGAPLPEALRRQGYEVTLRGERQRLPELQPLHLPWDGALEAVARSGACASLGEDGRLPAVVEIQGRWYNALGLESARLALGLPLEGLRYRWRRGVLSSLELKGVRYPLDARGRVLLPEGLPELPRIEISRLRSDAVALQRLRGRAVFFRPWPRQLGDAQAFEDQSRLFSALVERRVLTPPAGTPRRLLWLMGWITGVAGLALLPPWAALLAWALLPFGALQAFALEPQSLAQPLALALSAALLGLGWRMQRRRSRLALAEAELKGRAAQSQQDRWRRRLLSGQAGLDASYAVLGPLHALQGPAWEAWMERWGAFLDLDLKSEAAGVVFPAPQSERVAVQALDDLRGRVDGLQAGLALGSLSFRPVQSLGARHWRVEGPAKDLAIRLQALARKNQCLVLEKDYPAIRNLVQIQVLGQVLELPGLDEGRQVLNLLTLSGKL